MVKSVKFIHGADIHLDSPMVGLRSLPPSIFKRLQESTFKAFSRLIDAAIFHQVDFVILAGDLFDLEDRSIRAGVFLRKELARLEKEEIDVFVTHGNHDHLGKNKNEIKYSSNVHIFDESVTMKPFTTKLGTTVHLYGFSYPQRHVYERKVAQYKLKTGADFHIGILHGSIEGNHEHGQYAPFTTGELLEKNFNYWALGHIHKRAILHEEPPIVYPGNTQGRNQKEKGLKGCYLVHLQQFNTTLEFIETSDVIWTDIEVDATSSTTYDALYQNCIDQLEKVRRDEQGILANLQIKNVVEFDSLRTDELLEVIQDEEKENAAFVWPVSIEMEEKFSWNRNELMKESDFYGELFRTMDELSEMEGVLSPLYKHPTAKKYLPDLTHLELEEIKKEAETLLIEKLLKSR